MNDEYLKLIEKYKAGIEIGIISLEDFSNFVDNAIAKSDNVPDIFIEISLNINKGLNELLNAISDYCFNHKIILNKNKSDEIEFLTIVKNKYFNKEISIKECANIIDKIALYFGDFDLSCVSDYYDLAEKNLLYTLEDVDKIIKEKFKDYNII